MAFAVAAISLGSAAHPQSKGTAEQANSTEQAANTVATAIREVRPDKDQGCQDRTDERGSDLCAQWSAVDAARNAARATWAAVILSFVGTFLIFLTFLEQRKTSRAELRAYISVRLETFFTPPDGGTGEVSFALKNGGRTPAYNVVHMGNVAIMDFPLRDDPGHLFDKPIEGLEAPTVIHAESEIMGTIKGDVTLSIEKHLADIVAEKKAIYVIGMVRYRDTFDRPHATEFCQCLTGADYRRSRLASAAKSGQHVQVQWRYANFHNEAT